MALIRLTLKSTDTEINQNYYWLWVYFGLSVSNGQICITVLNYTVTWKLEFRAVECANNTVRIVFSAKSLHKSLFLFNGVASNQDLLLFAALQYFIINHLHFWGMLILNWDVWVNVWTVCFCSQTAMHTKYFGYNDWWLLSQGFYLHYHKAEKICRYICLHILTKCSNEY